MLAPLLGLLSITLVIIGLLGLGVESIMTWQAALAVGVGVVIAGMRWWVQQGRVAHAAWGTTVVLLLMSTSALLNDGTPAGYPVAFALTIAVAGFTVRRPGAMTWGVYAGAAIGGVAVLQRLDLVALRRPPEGWAIVGTHVVSMLMLAAVVHWVNRALEKARARAAREEETSTKLMQSLFRAQRTEAIGRLAGRVAHDFNNLLTVVSANASLLVESDGLSDEDRDACLAMIKAAESGAHLTQQLLTFGGRHAGRELRLDPADVIDDFRSVLAHMAEHATLRFVLGRGEGCVHADPGRLQQALANLVVNASHAVAPDGVIEIETRTTTLDAERSLPHTTLHAGRYIVVQVRDEGRGMNAETVAGALEPFFTTGEGSGLGLAVVHAVMEQAGGCVQIESAPERGTTISLWFPRVDGSPQWTPTRRGASVPELPGGTRVLLVDDNDDGRAALARILTQAGARVDTADSGHRALELASSNTYHVAVVDLIMPGMSGVALVNDMHARGMEMAKIFLTGYVEPAELRTGIAATLPVLYKPVSPADLVRAIRAACGVDAEAAG